MKKRRSKPDDILATLERHWAVEAKISERLDDELGAFTFMVPTTSVRFTPPQVEPARFTIRILSHRRSAGRRERRVGRGVPRPEPIRSSDRGRSGHSPAPAGPGSKRRDDDDE